MSFLLPRSKGEQKRDEEWRIEEEAKDINGLKSWRAERSGWIDGHQHRGTTSTRKRCRRLPTEFRDQLCLRSSQRRHIRRQSANYGLSRSIIICTYARHFMFHSALLSQLHDSKHENRSVFLRLVWEIMAAENSSSIQNNFGFFTTPKKTKLQKLEWSIYMAVHRRDHLPTISCGLVGLTLPFTLVESWNVERPMPSSRS